MMGWTKRALVQTAFEEIGVSEALGYEITAEMQQAGMNRLDAMMATLDANGIRLGYLMPVEHNGGDLDTDSGIPMAAIEAVYTALAVRVAPIIGKSISNETRQAAAKAMSILAGFEDLPTVRRDRMQAPAGAGNRVWRWTSDPFLDPEIQEPLSADQPDKLGNF